MTTQADRPDICTIIFLHQSIHLIFHRNLRQYSLWWHLSPPIATTHGRSLHYWSERGGHAIIVGLYFSPPYMKKYHCILLWTIPNNGRWCRRRRYVLIAFPQWASIGWPVGRIPLLKSYVPDSWIHHWFRSVVERSCTGTGKFAYSRGQS